MRTTLRQLEVFAAVARSLSDARTARGLHQSAVSMRVRQLQLSTDFLMGGHAAHLFHQPGHDA